MASRWPNLFVAGTPKAGTTSLYRYLDQHPEVSMATEKEPHFFDDTLPAGDEEARAEAEQAYLGLFEDAPEVTYRGEATPGYFSKPGTMARISEYCPEARFVVSLRDPIEALHSAYLMKIRHGDRRLEEEPEGFTRHVRSVLAAEPGSPERWPVEARLYATHYGRFLEHFPEAQIQLVLLDELSRDPHAVLRDIAAFLGVDEDAVDEIDTSTVHNPFGVPRNAIARWLKNDEKVARLARAVLPESLRVYLGEHALLAKTDKPQIEPEALKPLVEVFAPEIDRLEKRTGMDLAALRESWL